jgi:lipopolysaccharide transport system ATP-binding protein
VSDTVIKLQGIGKKYRIRHQRQQRYATLRDTIAEKMRSIFRPGRADVEAGAAFEDFWALKDISFEIKRGEVVGIIGRNGAGKSTLLKILSRITEPTTGRVEIDGRVASLLEVGTGFHPELSGRENIYLNGAVMGMSRAEITRRFDEIVSFAEVEKFLDTPVKRYSSGMYVRLAFAVAAHLEPEILIVDEVLAVGDAEFQKKCLGRMRTVSSEGRTILFVSHNLMAVRTLCMRGIVLKDGLEVFNGSVSDAVDTYSSGIVTSAYSEWNRSSTCSKSPEISYEHIAISVTGEQPLLRLVCKIRLVCRKTCAPSFIAVDIRNQWHLVIMQAAPNGSPIITGTLGIWNAEIEIALPPLIPGRYYLDFWVGPHYKATYDYVANALTFEVIDSPTVGRTYPHSLEHGSIVPFSRIVTCVHERA